MPELIIGTDDAGGLVTLDTDAKRYQSEGIRIGLFASSGAGKGYLLGVLLEELIGAGYPVVMVDPESELWTFRELGALVLGGPNGHAPFDPAAGAAIRAALAFALETCTPLVFDLHGRSPNEQRTAFEAIATPYWSLIEDQRQPAVLAITEAHLIAPEKLPRGLSFDTELLPRIQSGGRKRGAITIVETQRIADIANAVIGHCNIRAVGRIDFEDDFNRVKKGLPRDVDFATVSALESGQFFIPRLAAGVVHVRERRVTHGGGTPTGGPVQLRKDATPKALAAMAKQITILTQQTAAPGTSSVEPAPPGREPGAAAKRRGRGRREAALEQPSDAPDRLRAQIGAALADLAAEREKSGRLERNLVQTVDERDRYLHLYEEAASRADRTEEQLVAWITLRDVLAAAVAPALGDGTVPPESYTTAGGLTRDQVVALIREHGGAAGQGPALAPVEALRAQYLERSAMRLVERVRSLDATEREVLLFLLAHPNQQTTTSISKALTGQTGGAGFQRISDALRGLVQAGVGEQYKSGNNRPWRPAVDRAVRAELAPHSPTTDEVQDVINRALYVLQEGS